MIVAESRMRIVSNVGRDNRELRELEFGGDLAVLSSILSFVWCLSRLIVGRDSKNSFNQAFDQNR